MPQLHWATCEWLRAILLEEKGRDESDTAMVAFLAAVAERMRNDNTNTDADTPMPSADDNDTPTPRASMCVVCKATPADMVLLPCRHLCLCHQCIERVIDAAEDDEFRCPICRNNVNSNMRIYAA